MSADLIQSITAGTIACAVAIYAISRRERDFTSWLVASLMAGIAAWTFGAGLRGYLETEIGVPAPSHGALFLLQFAGQISVAPLWLLTAISLTRVPAYGRVARHRLVAAVLAPSFVGIVAALTNSSHHLMFKPESQALHGPMQEFAGPLLWGLSLWMVVASAAGVGLYCVKALRYSTQGMPLRGVALALTSVAPVTVSIARDFMGASATTGVTQSATALCIGVVFVLCWRPQLQEKLPMARRDVIENLCDGVIITNATGVILDCNLAASRIVNAEPNDLRGRPVIELFEQLKKDGSEAQFERAVDTVNSSSGPWHHSFRDRSGRFLEITTAVLHNGDDDPTGYFVVMRDHTERRRLEQLLRRTQRLETVAALAAGIAHEVNNPLAYVRANLSHVDRIAEDLEKEPDERRTECVREIREVMAESLDGIERIAGIIERMHGFSRIKQQSLEIVDLNRVVREALQLADLHRSDAIDIKSELSSDPLLVRGSSEHLVQALLNLLIYCKQATASARDAQVLVTTVMLEGLAEIAVEHNGTGLGAADQLQSVDPFFGSDDAIDGSQTGLAIAFGIIREHFGVLELASGAASGMRFQIRLPDSRSELGGEPSIL